MKHYILFILLILISSDSERVIGIFKIIDDLNEDTIEIRKNGTYTYKERGDSCWLWNDFTGKWKLEDITLTLFETKRTLDVTSEIERNYFDNSSDSIRINVKSFNGESIGGFKIKYESLINGLPKYEVKTDNKGIVKLPKFKIESLDKEVVVIGMDYVIYSDTISEQFSIDEKVDNIIIRLNQSPDSINQYYEHKFKYKDNKLTSYESPRLSENKIYKKL
ncbi:hypothetical protein D1816_02535 [Aquimarina sp. AD10]|uniref:hypothetical protein n=1 Tax=Aquimarina sp. AD10 TaxID=1714849 RepID=UPI000E550557|nr:hypothetical protein [Aquimarina sp. AD10]AXT59270.1 hypothetical protein D1816_02535 [Aquimarina sp. AD10]RKM92444.1 hypothetical protein D7033_20985 [Aquimarina sp. AD10]